MRIIRPITGVHAPAQGAIVVTETSVRSVIDGVTASLRRPLTVLRAERTLLRISVFRTIRDTVPFVAGLVPVGLYLLGEALFVNPADALFVYPTLGSMLFWMGCVGMLFIPYLQSGGLSADHILPLRKMGDDHALTDAEAVALAEKQPRVFIDQSITPDAWKLFVQTYLDCHKRAQMLRPMHVMLRAIETTEGRLFLCRCGINGSDIAAKLRVRIDAEPSGTLTDACDADSYVILHAAFLEAYAEKLPVLSILDLLLATLRLDAPMQRVFLDAGITMEDAAHAIAWVRFGAAVSADLKALRDLSRLKSRGDMNLALTARQTPVLNRLATDLTAQASSGKIGALLGRDKTLEEVFRVLHADTGNVLLIGEPGCGKSELIKGIAQLMASESVPTILQDKRLLRLDPGSLIAGAEGVGGIEERIRQVIEEVSGSGNILLAIEDIHHLLGAGSTRSSEDAGSMLMNALSEGKLSIIATTTPQEFAQYIRPRETFLRRFQLVRVPEMDRDGTLRVLEAATARMEQRHGVFITLEALAATYELTERCLPDQHLPDKAIRILDESCALARATHGSSATVERQEVAQVVEERTRSNVTAVTQSEADDLLLIEQSLKQKIVGQDAAITAIGSALRRSRTGLRRLDRPISTLLFLGPTGVGKTETAKAIAALSFGSEDRLIRLDLSEYRTPESLEKLLGTTGKSSPFLDAVRRCPAHLLLLDEFEKACSDVLNVFLQIFEDGRVTDGAGKTVNFRESFIIATSNVGSLKILRGASEGRSFEDVQQEVIQEDLLTALRPELVNRFDRVVLFRPLGAEHMAPIVSLQLRGITETLDKQGMSLQILPEALEDLARRGFDPLFGARGLRRLIQDTVEDEIAKLLLQGRVKRRDAIILGSGGAIAVRSQAVGA